MLKLFAAFGIWILECLAELDSSGPFAKGEAYLDGNHCPDLRDSVKLWSIWILSLSLLSFTLISITQTTQTMGTDSCKDPCASDTPYARRPVCKEKQKSNVRVCVLTFLIRWSLRDTGKKNTVPGKKSIFPGENKYSPWKKKLRLLLSCAPLVLCSSCPVVVWSFGPVVLWS